MSRLKTHETRIFIALFINRLTIFLFASCESKQQKLAQAEALEKMRIEEEMYDKYINNSLQTGDTSYVDFYGSNPSFYCGKGWNPEKIMKETPHGILRGGFIEDESFGKDDPQHLENNVLQYELISQSNGNFTAQPINTEYIL
jgi:hypothetical protein